MDELLKEIEQLKEQVARELKDNNGLRVTVGEYFKLKQQLEELIEIESDLDLHPDAEELDINRRIMSILNKFKEILEPQEKK